jgi:hypothetical protein
MSVPKIAAILSLASALSLLSFGPAQSAPLTNLSAAAIGTEQTDAVQVRWRRGWHNVAGAAPPTYYGGSYLGYPWRFLGSTTATFPELRLRLSSLRMVPPLPAPSSPNEQKLPERRSSVLHGAD